MRLSDCTLSALDFTIISDRCTNLTGLKIFSVVNSDTL